jgi:hypothetical protein
MNTTTTRSPIFMRIRGILFFGIFTIAPPNHSCALNGCSGDVPTHSLVFMCTHKHSGHVQYSFKGVHGQSQALRACSILTQRTHKHSGGVQYWLKDVHPHSQALRDCSILTQMRPFLWSHHGNLHSTMTQSRSCALNGRSHSLNGVHAYSMSVQGVFNTHSLASMRTQWMFRGCSHSLIGIHVHSMGVQGLFPLTHWHSRTLTSIQEVFNMCSACSSTWSPTNMFSNLRSMQRPYKTFSQFPSNAILLASPNKKSEKSWCHTWIDDW